MSEHSAFTKEDIHWLIYGAKMGLIISVFAGFAIGFWLTSTDLFLRGVAVVSGIIAFILFIGAFGVMRGIHPMSSRAMKLRIEEETHPDESHEEES